MEQRLLGGHLSPLDRAILSLFVLLTLFTPLVLAWQTALAAPARSLQHAPVQAASPLQWLRVEGNKLVNESGQTVTLRGVNVENRDWVWKNGPSISYELRAIPEATKNWGANLILLAFASGPVNRNDQTYLGFIDQLVATAKSNGAYTMLVWRYGEPDEEQPPMPDAAAESALGSLAKRYANEPSVLYGLQVEPHDVSWSTLKPRFTSMVKWVQHNNAKAVIAIPGTNWSRYVHYALTDPIPGNNLIYKSHVYDNWGAISANYKLPEVARKYPVLVGEFGVGTQSSYGDIQNLLSMMEGNGISWAAWIFHEKACPCLLAETASFTPTAFGSLVKQKLLAARDMAPAPTPTAPVLPGEATVFGDSLTWNDWSWNATINPNATSPVFEGTKALGITYDAAWAGMSLYSPGFNTAPYTALEFSLRSSGAALPRLYVSLYNSSGQIIQQVDPSPYAAPAVDGWRRVSIPLSALGGAGTTVTRLQMQDNSGSPQPAFYLDAVRFTAGAAAAPATPTPSSTPTPAFTQTPTATMPPQPTSTPAPQPIATSTPLPVVPSTPAPTPPSVSEPVPSLSPTATPTPLPASPSLDPAAPVGTATPVATVAPSASPTPGAQISAPAPSVQKPVVSMPSLSVPAGQTLRAPVRLSNAAAPGLVSFSFRIAYDPTKVQIVEITPGSWPWNTNHVTYDNSKGRVTIANTLLEPFTGSADMAVITFRSLGLEGAAAPLDIQVVNAMDQSLDPYALAAEDGLVQLGPAVKAQIAIRSTGMAIFIGGPQAVDPVSGQVLPDRHVTHYTGRLLYSPDQVEVRRVAFLEDGAAGTATTDNAQGVTKLSVTLAPGAQPEDQIQLLIRLKGSVLTSAAVTFVLDDAGDRDGAFVPVRSGVAPLAVQFQRGDVRPDGTVDFLDAVVGFRYLLGLNPRSPVNIANFASVNHDGDEDADIADLMDLLVLLQYLLEMRTSDLQPMK